MTVTNESANQQIKRIFDRLTVRVAEIDKQVSQQYESRVEQARQRLHNRLVECLKTQKVEECKVKLQGQLMNWEAVQKHSTEIYRCVNSSFMANRANDRAMDSAVESCLANLHGNLSRSISKELDRIEHL